MTRKMTLPLLLLCAALALAAEETPSFQFIDLNQWRVRPTPPEEYAKKQCENKGQPWYWAGTPENAYKTKEIFEHQGAVVFYIHFHVGALPENATPILLVNHLAPESVVMLNGKKLEPIKQKKHGDNPFDTEYWYEIPHGLLRQNPSSPNDNNRSEIWMPAINRKNNSTTPAIARIVFENPDKIAEREKARKLQYPYLYDADTLEDPYVARHW